MFDTALVLLILAGLLVIVAISQPLAARLKLPQSVVLAAIGIGIGALPTITAQFGLPGPIDVATDLLAKLPVNSATLLYVFLPLLVFEAGVLRREVSGCLVPQQTPFGAGIMTHCRATLLASTGLKRRTPRSRDLTVRATRHKGRLNSFVTDGIAGNK